MRGPEDGTQGVLVHNDHLQLLLEAGPPMLVALLVFSVLCAWSWGRVAWRLRRTESSPADDRTLVLVHAGLVCVGVLLAHALINFPLFDPALLNITLVAGVIGISTTF
ncbi:MAG: hypothetical protein U5R48_15635 [Gammaproteobacteria bacterium]|nr:hypothetical protein [Gammaproteobacteria bacterium]